MKSSASILKSTKSSGHRHSHDQGRGRDREKSIKHLSQEAVRLSHEKQIPLKNVIEEFEREILLRVLTEVGANQKEAAQILGLKYTTLHEKLKRHGIRIKKISKIVLHGFFLFWSLHALNASYNVLVKEARENAEVMNCQLVVRFPFQADLKEPENSVATAIPQQKAV